MVRRVLYMLAFLVLTLSTSAQAPRAPDTYLIFSNLMGVGCTHLATTISFFYGGTTSGYQYATLVNIAGEVYMDGTAGFFSGTGVHQIDLYDSGVPGDRGMQTASFPLPPAKKVKVEATVFDTEYIPVWRSVATLSKCNDGTLKKVKSYKIKTLLKNGSFELATDDNQPRQWKANGGAQAADSAISCFAAYAGDCALEVVPSGAKQKYSQTWTGAQGTAGYRLELAAMQEALPAFTGTGKITAALTFANGATATLVLPAPAAGSDWVYTVDDLVMPAALTTAVVTIEHKNGAAGVWRIDGLALSVLTPSSFIPAERSPLPAPGISDEVHSGRFA